MYSQMKETFKNEYKEGSDTYRQRLTLWRSQPVITRADGPTNITRARELGYRAKEGVLIARVRLKGGKSKRAMHGGGRKPSKSGRFFSRAKSLQSIAEERAATRFSNCEVLNSYFVGQSGSDKFYEVILIDKASPSVQSLYSGMLSQKGRAYRGLTHSGRKHRGIATRGYGTIKRRPSRRAGFRS